ncbi:hypothetical protein FO519_002853 [Halicephalobus sp. NKZ332]|nr:hypothetical protein FO519_002853 [Halicephalobus sp. NKZ332]
MSSNFIIIGGVSGCGKSTVGSALAERIEVEFVDGDRFHSKKNIEKMSAGIPLNDEDRSEWLHLLSTFADENQTKVVACSALKRSYRVILSSKSTSCKIFILDLPESVLRERIIKRQGHFVKAQLLKSQLDTLELPPPDEKSVFVVDGNLPVNVIVEEIISLLK